MLRALFVGLGVLLTSAQAVVPSAGLSPVGAAPVLAGGSPDSPPPPIPSSPADNDTVFGLAPGLKVEALPFPALYHFRVFEGVSLAAEGYSLTSIWVVVGQGGRVLQRGHSYHWTCRAHDGTGWSEWFSPDWRFTVSSRVPPPRPKRPEDGAVVYTRRPTLSVRPVGVGCKYHFQVYCGRTLVAEKVTSAPAWRCGGGGGLEPGEFYTWTCRVETETDTSDWFGPMWHFSVEDVPQDGQSADGPSACGSRLRADAATVFGRTARIAAGTHLGDLMTAEFYRTDGARVRVIRPAERELTWDGRDEQGRPVPAGTYLCLLSGTRGRELVRLTKVE